MQKEVKKRFHRSEVPIELTWDLTHLYKSKDAWLENIDELNSKIAKLESYKQFDFKRDKKLYDCLCLLEDVMASFSQVYLYASLNQMTDNTNPEYQSDAQKARAILEKYKSTVSFIEPAILALSNDELQCKFKEEPKLQEYKPYFEKIQRKKAHLLSADTEKVLGSLQGLYWSPYDIYTKSKATDLQFESFKNDSGEELVNSITLYENNYELSSDTAIRRNAYKSFNKTLKNYVNTYAAIFATEVRKQVVLSRIRGYKSATHMLIEPYQITVEMYNNQIDVIYKDLAPHMQRFARLKQRLLGLNKIKFCDLKASIKTDAELTASYEDIKNIIIESLKVLGDNYKKFVTTAFEERWVDYCDNIGKKSGAICSSTYNVHPYILITLQANLRSALTLAHELGHAGVSQFIDKDMSLLNVKGSKYIVEAPSTMNELLVGQYLSKEKTDIELKKWIILELMSTYYHNFVTHLLEAEFHRRVLDAAEKDISLTAKLLCNTKLDVIKGFWGNAVDIDEDASLTWMRQQHYYAGLISFFYSSGLTISTIVASHISKDEEAGVKRWTDFLGSLCNNDLDEILKLVDIDMTKPEPVKQTVEYIGKLISELEELYK